MYALRVNSKHIDSIVSLKAYILILIQAHIFLVNIQWLEAKANKIHVKYDPQVILYIGQAQLWDTAQ